MNDPTLSLPPIYLSDQDTWVMNVTLKVVEELQPRVVLMNLPDVDHVGHFTGANQSEITQAMSNVDALIGRLVDLYKRLGIFDQTLWVIMGDHGMLTSKNRIPKSDTGGDIIVHHIIRGGGKIDLATGESDFGIWLKDPNATVVKQAANYLSRQNVTGVSAVFHNVRQDDEWVYLPTHTTRQSLPSQLLKAYEYILKNSASVNSPEILVIFREDTMRTGVGKEPPWTAHGGASWHTQHIILIVSGKTVPKGVSSFPARVIDIYPTITRLMDLPRERTDGIVLADAVPNPSNEELNTFKSLQKKLTDVVTALKDESSGVIYTPSTIPPPRMVMSPAEEEIIYAPLVAIFAARQY